MNLKKEEGHKQIGVERRNRAPGRTGMTRGGGYLNRSNLNVSFLCLYEGISTEYGRTEKHWKDEYVDEWINLNE